jgi:hypothetical protein
MQGIRVLYLACSTHPVSDRKEIFLCMAPFRLVFVASVTQYHKWSMVCWMSPRLTWYTGQAASCTSAQLYMCNTDNGAWFPWFPWEYRR